MRKLLVLCSILIFSASVLAQSPSPTNAPQFTVNIAFLGAGPYGQSNAMDVGANQQLTTNDRLRYDIITMPSVSYTGYLFGTSYDVAAVCPFLASTTLNCGNFMPYVTGSAGLGRVQQGSNPAIQGVAYKFQVGANYTLNKVGFNLFEIGYCNFGVNLAGQSRSGWCGQTGLQFLFGTNAAATQAKQDRASKAFQKKKAKLDAAIKKAQGA